MPLSQAHARLARRGTVLLVSGLALLAVLATVWPLPTALLSGDATHPVQMLDRNGTLLYEFRKGAPGSQLWITYAQIPQTALHALIDTEDRTFLEHPGVSLRGILRALYQDVTGARIVSGGSTITQQLVRVRLPSSRSLLGKIREAWLALRLDAALSKEQILEAYMNSAYFGHQAYGLQAAAKTYFGKGANELSVAETSLLIGLLQSPSAYDPFLHFARARERQGVVLASMHTQGDITEEEQRDAEQVPLVLAANRLSIQAPHFVFWALNRGDVPADATEIRTTLDLNLQRAAERAVGNHLATLADKNVTSAAVVVLDAQNGDVLAMVGSSDYFDAGHDGAVNVAVSPRQPGSTMKAFTYALALTKGATAATTVSDVETQFFTQEGNPYVPRNYDYGYHGLVRYREALANSYNIAAVNVLQTVGVATLLQFLRDDGITSLTDSPEHYGLALTLGDAEVSLLELARAYAVFPRGGKTLAERAFTSEREGASRQILDPKVAWLISDILSDNDARLPQFGESGPLTFDFPVAAKTGTTRNSRDNWTVGYTGTRVVAVWVGNADNSPMKDTSGVTGAGPIFHDVMEAAMTGQPKVPFPRPAGITEREICTLSGKLPTDLCPQRLTEKFIAGTEPTAPDTMFQAIAIDRRNGLLATPECPSRFVVRQTFALFPPDLRTWASENGWPQPPRESSSLCGGSAQASTSEHWLTITRPQQRDAFELDPLVPDSNEKIIFAASAGSQIKTIDWYLNGTMIGKASAPDFSLPWQPRTGNWTVEARAGDLHDSRMFSVVKNSPESGQ